MSTAGTWAKRSAMIAVGAAAIVTVVSTPSFASGTISTTGAAGYSKYIGNGDYSLYAKDTLSDGHCAQWQYKEPGGSWTNDGPDVCSSTYTWVGAANENFQIRICRTGVWNCSSAVKPS